MASPDYILNNNIIYFMNKINKAWARLEKDLEHKKIFYYNMLYMTNRWKNKQILLKIY